MKKKNLLVIAAFFIAFLGTSCKKSVDTVANNNNNNVSKNFADIKTNSSFKWNSTKQINMIITGMTTTNPVSGTLKVINPKTGESFYSGFHKLQDNLNLKLTIPTAADSLQIQFGSIRKNYSANTSGFTADYLPTISPDQP